MTHIEIWLLALGVAMDCFTVSIAGGVIMKRMKWRPVLLMSFFFGFFQAMNPLLGWLGAGCFREQIDSFDHWVAFAILLFLGVKMIADSFKEEEQRRFNPEKLSVILALAVATSIDAFAVGISFSCIGVKAFQELLYPLMAIGFTSFFMSLIGLFFGVKCGRRFASRLHAEVWGGAILIIIGVKVLVEHTCM